MQGASLMGVQLLVAPVENLGKSAMMHALLCDRGTLYVEPSLADKLGRFPDTYMSVANGWNKGLVFINGYNIVRAGMLGMLREP